MGSCKCMRKEGIGSGGVSSKMGIKPHSASAGERIKKAARLSDRAGIFDHGSDNKECSTP
jgi:hypothetical protein